MIQLIGCHLLRILLLNLLLLACRLLLLCDLLPIIAAVVAVVVDHFKLLPKPRILLMVSHN